MTNRHFESSILCHANARSELNSFCCSHSYLKIYQRHIVNSVDQFEDCSRTNRWIEFTVYIARFVKLVTLFCFFHCFVLHYDNNCPGEKAVVLLPAWAAQWRLSS